MKYQSYAKSTKFDAFGQKNKHLSQPYSDNLLCLFLIFSNEIMILKD